MLFLPNVQIIRQKNGVMCVFLCVFALFYGNAFVVLLYLLVTLQVADVVAFSGHFHGVYGCLGAEPCDVTAWCVGAAAVFDAFFDEVCVLACIVVEGWAAPVCFGCGRLFGHAQYAVLFVDGDDAALEEALFVCFPKAHDAGGLFLVGVVDEALQAEVQQVVAGDDEHVVVEVELFDGELYVADGSESCFVGGCAVVHDGYFLWFCVCPVLEVTGELVVGDDDVFVDESGFVYVVDEPVEDCFVAYCEEWFGLVFGEGV